MYHSSLERVKKERNLTVEWRAFELRPREAPVSPEERAEKEAYVKQAWPQIQEMARNVYGLNMEPGSLDVDTRLAHAATLLARDSDKSQALHVALFQAHWERGEDIGDEAVLERIHGEVGLPWNADALRDEALLQAVRTEAAEAGQLGIRGVPATVVANKYLLSGCRPADELEKIFAEIESKESEQ